MNNPEIAVLRDGEVFWKTRPSGKPGDTPKQTMTIEPVADGIKLTTVIDFGSGAGMTTTYVTKLDGAEVPEVESQFSGPGGALQNQTVIVTFGLMTSRWRRRLLETPKSDFRGQRRGAG